jgi:hypothetical protein
VSLVRPHGIVSIPWLPPSLAQSAGHVGGLPLFSLYPRVAVSGCLVCANVLTICGVRTEPTRLTYIRAASRSETQNSGKQTHTTITTQPSKNESILRKGENSTAGTLSREGWQETDIIKFLLPACHSKHFCPEFKGSAGQPNNSDKAEQRVIFTKLLLCSRTDAWVVFTAIIYLQGILWTALRVKN